jgi:hypothetical protein
MQLYIRHIKAINFSLEGSVKLRLTRSHEKSVDESVSVKLLLIVDE